MGLVVRFIGPCFDKDFVQKYWEINEIPKFEHRVEDLIKLKGFSSMREGTNYIRANSIAILQCDDCAKIIGEYRVRSEVKIEKYQDKEGLFCDDCFASKTHPIQIIEKVIVVKKISYHNFVSYL